ncbi:MAG: cysteinylglycine-S-conjugate dipeptidase [Gaiellales bacterium]|nr:cysteinylglycine-S-conjugate dipeptidase [Gaiellales bacterium]
MPSAAVLRERVKSLMPQSKTELAEIVSFKSVADPRQFPPEECEKAANWVADKFKEVGFADTAAHATPDGSKAVVGHARGPKGAPSVLLYVHYDVQPPLGEDKWNVPVWELTEKDGRWYGRGASDCKGNIVMLLTALRALGAGAGFPLNLTLVAEGSEEQGTGGLEQFVPENHDLLAADAILVCDTGNFAVGVPSMTTSLRGLANVQVTVRSLRSALHSGMFGGPAPDALAALIHMLSSLRDGAGNTVIDGLANTKNWTGATYPPEQFRKDANVLDGVALLGDGTVSDLLWSRPVATVLGIDCPPVVGSSAAIQPEARGRINLRVPPGIDARHAQDRLIEHLTAAAPWNVQVEFDREANGEPFVGSTNGPAFDAMRQAMCAAYGREVTTEGQGGSIPLCNVLQDTFPQAEIMLIGVEEPLCLIHAPNESVDPSEIENMALSQALFLQAYAHGSTR